jgi:manganese/zinc/iron transport system permease protein
MGFLVTATCGLIGNYLILRRMALIGDAISHSILPGIAVAFLISHSRNTWAVFFGALGAGIFTTLLIEWIHKKSRVKQDAAIGIAFSSLFALGVFLISKYADKVDLDQDCVLYGEIGFVPLEPFVTWRGIKWAPEPVVEIAFVGLFTVILICLFYKELLVSSFDPGLSTSMGIKASRVHYALMGVLSLVVVTAFKSVGAILVLAMLIIPGALGSLLAQRLPWVMGWTIVTAALSSLLGVHLAVWFQCSISAAMVVAAGILFVLAWIVSPSQGLLHRWWTRSANLELLEIEKARI